jgi:molecular chaperone GrpE
VSEDNNEPTPEPGEDQASADAMDEALAELLDEEAAADQQPAPAEPESQTDQLSALVAERTNDLQRLHAEYANYKKRVDRDRALSRAAGIEAVILDLLPILDSIEAAREHDELVGGFKLVAEEFEKTASKYGLETFGEVGDLFDPQVHEALMQLPMEGELAGPTVSAVMQRGVRLNERVIRPARVGVADPDA